MITLAIIIGYLIIGAILSLQFTEEEIIAEFKDKGIPDKSTKPFIIFIVLCWLPILIIDLIFFSGKNKL